MRMNRSLLVRLALVVSACVAAAGCSSATTADSSYSPDGTSENAGRGATDVGAGGTAPGTPSDPGGDTTAPPTGPVDGTPQQAGQLTAGVWDDNLNYEFFGQYLLQSKSAAGASMFTQADRDAAHLRAAQQSAKTELDVALVLDTTSSMGDEIKYLQAEFDAIATTIKTKFPQATPRFGLVVYRDLTDEYVTKNVPFTTDVNAFRTSLAAQSAAGGGDIPEAVPEGLTAGAALDWRTTADVARVMFWVADAPQHPGEEQAVNAAVTTAVQKGIHVYPVASSGVDPNAELTMRATAQITNGRYVFLTDDSGIGNTHAEPHIPCYVVTKLQGAMVRMVESEMIGHRAEPAPAEVIRTVGSPVDGKCTLQNKTDVVLY
ncbi:MAG: hypothetical protein JWP87_3504 [Labilithrix sp.]|nr:hypothetical protein [Labilithrix sp.]